MKILYLLRHAKSSWKDAGQDDFDRPLNGRGKRAARAMGEYLASQGMRPDMVLCSAARRTRETLELVGAGFTQEPTADFRKELYLATPFQMLEHLARLDDKLPSAMLVGHNPGHQELALLLAGSGEAEAMAALRAKFPTGACVMLTFDADRWQDIQPATAHLEAFIRPKDIE